MEKTRIDTSSLSFFRFLNIAIIVFLHYGIRENPYLTHYARAGSIIVFFYMLSGFVLFLGCQRKGCLDWPQYLVKRGMSVLPLYYFGFVVYLAILVYMGDFSLTGFLLALFCVQAWVPGYEHYINPPSWFVSGLMFFYVIFPLIFARIRKTSPAAGKLLFSSICLWVLTIMTINIGFNPGYFSGYFLPYFSFIESFPLANFCSFYMGVCGAYYVSERHGQARPENSFKSLLSTIAVLFLFTLTLTIHYHEGIGKFMQARIPYEAGLYAPVVLLLILNLCTEKNYLTRLFSMKSLMALGVISYSLYILQAPVYHIFMKFVAKPLAMGPLAAFGFFFVSLIIIASVVTRIEHVAIKRVFSKGRDPGPGSGSPQNGTLGQTSRLKSSRTGK
jgi:peptidoglycan/LPS O-acetylase OafA/YrhL